MITLAVHSVKGGVGKTAAAVNIAHLAASDGARTLLWDLDSQAAATFYLRVKPKVRGGLKNLVKGKSDILDLIKGTDFDNLDLLPSDFSYRKFDLMVDDAKEASRSLKKQLKALSTDYDLVFLDCPPGVSALTEAILDSCDAILAPVVPTPLSLNGLEQLLAFRDRKGYVRNQYLPFFSLVDLRKSLHRNLVENPPDILTRHGLLETAIPYATDVEKMGSFRAPLASFAPNSKAAHNFQALWNEISTRLP